MNRIRQILASWLERLARRLRGGLTAQWGVK